MRDFRQAFRMMREVCKVANILVCDDDKDIVEAISIYLEQEGYTVLKAYDGVEAINVLRSQPASVDHRYYDAEVGWHPGYFEDKGRESSSDHYSFCKIRRCR